MGQLVNGRRLNMAVRYEYQIVVSVVTEKAFAAIDDLPLTAKWLPPCVSLNKIGAGSNSPGDKLRYVFKQGGKQCEMAGEILDRVPGNRLYCKYTDQAFAVFVDLLVAPVPDGTMMTHIVEIAPKSFLGKLMSPLIRLGLGKQTRDAAKNLKKLLESS